VDPKPKAGEEAGAAADEAPNREDPKVGAEEAAAEDEEKREEPKVGAGEEAAAGWEKEKADGVEEKEKGEEAVEPAAAEPPKPKEVAMAGAERGDLGEILAWFCRCWLGRAACGAWVVTRHSSGQEQEDPDSGLALVALLWRLLKSFEIGLEHLLYRSHFSNHHLKNYLLKNRFYIFSWKCSQQRKERI